MGNSVARASFLPTPRLMSWQACAQALHTAARRRVSGVSRASQFSAQAVHTSAAAAQIMACTGDFRVIESAAAWHSAMQSIRVLMWLGSSCLPPVSRQMPKKNWQAVRHVQHCVMQSCSVDWLSIGDVSSKMIMAALSCMQIFSSTSTSCSSKRARRLYVPSTLFLFSELMRNDRFRGNDVLVLEFCGHSLVPFAEF